MFEAGGIKAEDNISDLSSETCGRKRIRDDSNGESAIAARLAAKIKHALEVSIHVKSSLVVLLLGKVRFHILMCLYQVWTSRIERSKIRAYRS